MTGSHGIRLSFLMCPLAPFRQRAKPRSFSRGKYRLLKDRIFTTREPLSTRYYEIRVVMPHMRAKACLPLSFVASRLMYLCISSDWLLLDSHSFTHTLVENMREAAIFIPHDEGNNIANVESTCFKKRHISKSEKSVVMKFQLVTYSRNARNFLLDWKSVVVAARHSWLSFHYRRAIFTHCIQFGFTYGMIYSAKAYLEAGDGDLLGA